MAPGGSWAAWISSEFGKSPRDVSHQARLRVRKAPFPFARQCGWGQSQHSRPLRHLLSPAPAVPIFLRSSAINLLPAPCPRRFCLHSNLLLNPTSPLSLRPACPKPPSAQLLSLASGENFFPVFWMAHLLASHLAGQLLHHSPPLDALLSGPGAEALDPFLYYTPSPGDL